ncbi:unnamed protein product [marine sediment metagenome]|uniref:Uncharacterized protein n=1 Tax=marine sediment metagenome TaxID=412755 RepID=X1RYW8_9ZZZZ
MIHVLKAGYFEFQPGDGTNYCVHVVEDMNGGLLVITHYSTWRYYEGDYLKFLHGSENEWTRTALFDYLENASVTLRSMEIEDTL